jgi:hypothetical protein
VAVGIGLGLFPTFFFLTNKICVSASYLDGKKNPNSTQENENHARNKGENIREFGDTSFKVSLGN